MSCKLTSEFWDCDCEKNYIHKTDPTKKDSDQVCSICHMSREDGPDSHVNEIEKELNNEQDNQNQRHQNDL